MKLYNKVDRKVLEEQMEHDNTERTTISFYKYWHIGNPPIFRDHFYYGLSQLNVLGRIYVSYEGVNAQITCPTKNMKAFKAYLNTITPLEGVRLNTAVENESHSFIKLKIKVRQKIVADGLNDDTFDVTNIGKHVSAKEFNSLADDPNTVMVDMRNHYESEVGHFEGAWCPDVDSFREELEVVEDKLKNQKDKNLLMYCTGGIRCEKASAYFKHIGFENVYQLEGGIIKYARDAKEHGLENKFKGLNFVFDRRLGERISEDVISVCHQCGNPSDHHTNCKNVGCNLLFIQCDECAGNMEGTCSDECKEIIRLPDEEQKEIRKKQQAKERYFKKGRSEKLRFKV